MQDFFHLKPCLLWKGGVVGVSAHALLLPCRQNLPPAPLHRSKDGDVERLQEVSRVLWQENKPDVVNGAEIGDVAGQMCSQIVTNEDFYVLLWQLLDMQEEHLPYL